MFLLLRIFDSAIVGAHDDRSRDLLGQIELLKRQKYLESRFALLKETIERVD